MSGDPIDMDDLRYVGRLVDGAILGLRCGRDPDVFVSLSQILSARLGPLERFCLAWAALQAVEREDLDLLSDAVSTRAGMPGPVFLQAADDAAKWVSGASAKERKLYLWACWRSLPEAERAAFLRKVGAEVAA